jgi:hypothetical protein
VADFHGPHQRRSRGKVSPDTCPSVSAKFSSTSIERISISGLIDGPDRPRIFAALVKDVGRPFFYPTLSESAASWLVDRWADSLKWYTLGDVA